jgi:hypothetical protein
MPSSTTSAWGRLGIEERRGFAATLPSARGDWGARLEAPHPMNQAIWLNSSW